MARPSTLEVNADDYMTKPSNPTVIHRKLLEALGLEEASVA
jgi:DNA-binding response OmpR family regulator